MRRLRIVLTLGYAGASACELTLRLGLGQFHGADRVAVLWPSGRQAVLRNVGAGQRVVIE